jgi:hypothetical protein
MRLRTAYSIALVLLVAVGIGNVGCSDPQTLARHAVRGQVLVDDEPLADGIVRFIAKPNAANGNLRSHGAEAYIVDGEFVLDKTKGPTAGEFEVVFLPNAPEIEEAMVAIAAGSDDPLKSQGIPQYYQRPGEFSRTVVAGGQNRFRFELFSD